MNFPSLATGKTCLCAQVYNL